MNIRLLLARLCYKDITNAEFASLLGIGRSTLYRKLSGRNEFTRAEIAKIREALELDDDALVEIFFKKRCV